uniref:DNA helicase n=1 Tax=Globodera rostochiensis TaxID=31243 RepID=A0A914H8X1_GLORO
MHGLLEDDLIWEKTLTEASLHRWPDQMYCQCGTTHFKRNASLADIDWRLYNFGYSCVHFGLPDPPNSIAKNTDKAIEEFFFGDEDLNHPPGQQNANQPQQVVPTLNSDQQMRMGQCQQEYLQMCRRIGLGETGEHFWIPPQYLVQSSEELINFDYPDFEQLLGNDKELLRRLILAPHIETCDEVNELMMEKVPDQTQRFGDGTPSSPTKLGCVVVLLINKSDREGLINGTRIVIEQLGDDKIVGRAINGTALGGQVRFFIERTRQVYEEKAHGGIKYERLQFPITSAFAMTINKGQGQTIDIVGIDLEREVFSHGQLYTAFSTATDGNNVRVYAPKREVDA